LHGVGASAILTCVGSEGAENWSELLISLETLLVVGHEPLEDYEDNYVRKYSGPVRIQREDGGKPKRIGEIEVWYIDGSRAADNGLDIVDVCDSMTQAEYAYASAVYTDGSIGSSIVEEPFYNDVLVIHALVLTLDFQGLGLEARIVRKIADTLGYHCAAVVFDPDRVSIANEIEFRVIPTMQSGIVCIVEF
jgi:hypothetical protein